MEPTTAPQSSERGERLTASELRDGWPVLAAEDRLGGFRDLGHEEAEAFFSELGAQDQAALLIGLPPAERRLWMRQLAPDDAADVLQEVPPEVVE
jgi:magnesium transporter